MDAEETLECISCGTVILYPDGALRCSIDFSLAKLKCDEFASGKPKIFKFGQVITAKKIMKKRRKKT